MIHPKKGENRAASADREWAEKLAVAGLGHLAGEPELLSRFLALSGIEPHRLREAAQSPEFLAGVLDFYLGDESALLAFAASLPCEPGKIAAARILLAGHGDAG